MKKLVIIGAGIAGSLAAMYFRKRLPEIDVTLVGRTDRKRPVVGESTVEITTHFFEALGLGTLLEEKHYHKYGLTYYFKLNAQRDCRRYVVHEAPGVLRMPAYNLNRNTFDRDIRDINLRLGIQAVEADVADIQLSAEPASTHRVTLRHSDGRHSTLDADWVIDATGRNRFLARKLGLARPPAYQRSSFWFRLSRFDRTCLSNMQKIRVEHHTYDSYYVTHHFYGKGYWVWLIPMRSESGHDLISIGITFRPEIMGGEVTSMDAFLDVMSNDHPVIAELVRSGSVVDTNLYRNYMYEAEQYYSEDGWFLIGDAGFTFDPANSAGLAYLAHQIPQTAAMIKKDAAGVLTRKYVECLEAHLRAQLSLQDTWSKWYEFMHEPLKMAWTLLVANLGYFHVSLPNYVNGAFLDAHQARHFADLLPRHSPAHQPPGYPFPCLLDAVAASHQEIRPELLPNLYSRSVNWKLYRADESARPYYAARYFRMLVLIRFRLLRMVKWKPGLQHLSLLSKHLFGAAADAARSLALCIRPALFYKYGRSPERLASPFHPGASFLDCEPHDAALSPPLVHMHDGGDLQRRLIAPNEGEAEGVA